MLGINQEPNTWNVTTITVDTYDALINWLPYEEFTIYKDMEYPCIALIGAGQIQFFDRKRLTELLKFIDTRKAELDAVE